MVFHEARDHVLVARIGVEPRADAVDQVGVVAVELVEQEAAARLVGARPREGLEPLAAERRILFLANRLDAAFGRDLARAERERESQLSDLAQVVGERELADLGGRVGARAERAQHLVAGPRAAAGPARRHESESCFPAQWASVWTISARSSSRDDASSSNNAINAAGASSRAILGNAWRSRSNA